MQMVLLDAETWVPVILIELFGAKFWLDVVHKLNLFLPLETFIYTGNYFFSFHFQRLPSVLTLFFFIKLLGKLNECKDFLYPLYSFIYVLDTYLKPL